MTRKHWLLITATVVTAAMAQACGLEPAEPDTMNRTGALTSLRAEDLDEGLPGCLEALNQDQTASRRWESVELARLTSSPGLGVLVVDGRQICVDNLDEIETWMATGSWPRMEMRTESEDSGAALPKDRGDVAHEQVGTFSTDQNANLGRDDDDPHERTLDDSNPLPPYPNPMHLQ